MLAQNFKSAADLGISEEQKDALAKTLVLLETGKLTHYTEELEHGHARGRRKFSGLFAMDSWAGAHECGTVACIGGTAEIIGGVRFGSDFSSGLNNTGLHNLFCPKEIRIEFWRNITTGQAARALRSYLTTGDARWDLAVAHD